MPGTCTTQRGLTQALGLMKDFISLLIHPSLVGINVFVVLGVAMVWLATEHKSGVDRLFRAGWAVSLALIAIWMFQQEHLVRLGSSVPTVSQPVAVAFKGTTRYVSETQAFLYDSGKWFLFGAVLVVIGIDRLFLRKRHEA